MDTGDWALVISGISAALAIASFVWNIWQRFIFVRPSLQVTFQKMRVFQGGEWGKHLLTVDITNMGPGPVILRTVIAKLRRENSSRAQYALLNPIDGDPTADIPHSIGPYSGGLPKKIDAGEVATFYFPFTKDTEFLSGKKGALVAIGVVDTYGRKTWCRRRDVEAVLKAYAELINEESKSAYGTW